MEGMDEVSPNQAIGLVPTEEGFNVVIVDLEEPVDDLALAKHLN